MRAALPPLLLLALDLVIVAVVAAPAVPPAPLLLVARSACRQRNITLLSQIALENYAAEVMQLSNLSRTYNLLGYEETCGSKWEAEVTKNALATLGAGGGVVFSGRPGAAVCGSVSGAAQALGRAQPAACAEPRARGAAVARVARELRWRRALLQPAPDAADCAAALREAEHALTADGVYVVRAFDTTVGKPDPHVVILCDTSIETTTLRIDLNYTEILLLHVVTPDAAQNAVPMNYYNNTKLETESIASSLVSANIQFFQKLFMAPSPTKRSSHSIAHQQITNSNIFSKVSQTVDDLEQNETQWSSLAKKLESLNGTRFKRKSHISSNTMSLNLQKSIHRSKRESTYENSKPLKALLGDLNEFVSNRLLILSDEHTDTNPFSYREILEAAINYIETENTKIEISRKIFFLYRNIIVNDTILWKRLATIKTLSKRLLKKSEKWFTNTSIDPLEELELKRLGSMRNTEDILEFKTISGVEIAWAAFIPLCIACVCFGAALALGAACTKHAVTRHTPRRPRAVPVLAPADFQFPADERRRVGEGMETMLSWLQQLHEFGGPESDKPDLLKQPEPLGQSAPSSTCSVTRLAPDNRTRFKGDPVHMKYLPAATLELRRKSIDILLVMQSLRHENLNPFIGCLAEVRPALVFAACGRGSLEDVLVADDIRLDWTFRLSLLSDLVRGMRYLHSSPLRVHARLSSRNCVVDSRWVLRVTDFGLPAFATAQALPYPPRAARDLLWTAPELLRESGTASVPGGTQAGDVFSFAIIMQEVIVRGEPYCMLSLTPEEIVEKLTRPPPLIRPSVSMGAAPPEAVSVMRQCWSEQPDLRPDFNRLYEVFRHMHRGRKINIVDSMFQMLEKYSNNLEELIKERTEQLDMEKKKTEQLLNRMLPRSVAERLMLGLRVEPEEFEEVSIYFSDIVGFTALAARSSPVQVVDLLNDLYTTFDAAIEQYRVYKVETIGDAYMVVGGLPTRRADHAESVATMALHLLHLAGRFRIRHLPSAPLHLRIGLHTGACCAGVVGLTMPRYCLFGDTVNTASRMESTGAAWRIQISNATAERLMAAGGYRLRSRGLTQVKGKGAMHTYWLLGKDDFDKPLPTPPPLESEEVLFETEVEHEYETSEPSCDQSNTRPALTQSFERQRSDPSTSNDKFSWQRSGAVSAESSPPAPRALPRARYLRSSVSTVASLLDTPRLSDRWGGGGARVLRRQWSLERGDALAAAAAEAPPPPLPPAAPAPRSEPLALRAPPPRAPAPRYRTRRAASTLDVSDR